MPFAASRVFSLVTLLSLLAAFSAVRADDWKTLTVPDAWRSVPGGELAPIDGYSWYRAMVKVPPDWDGQELTLFLEALDDARSAWVKWAACGGNRYVSSAVSQWTRRTRSILR
jgi:hypothetical protein